MCKLSEVLRWLTLPILVNHLNQGEHNPDTGLFCRKSIHDLDSATETSEDTFNDVGGSKRNTSSVGKIRASYLFENPHIMERFGCEGFLKAIKNFTWDKVVDTIVKKIAVTLKDKSNKSISLE
ncbi:unnamed protein product [marine sediment metagenome]|uniref:Uncharacterized protein n=1 Tax=marine sediment metagenome TaxID=412755 RepID=X1F584_9ZZZZ